MAGEVPLVLVVDDDPAARELVCRALSRLGYSCMSASDGREALEFAADHLFDLVITDLDMPRMGGLALIERLRLDGPEIPVVIMTAYADVDSAQRALRLRVSDYLVKPFDNLAELQAAARRAIETRTSRASPEALVAELGDRLRPPSREPTLAGTPSDRVPEMIAGFKIVELLGKGGMGTVYKAIQVSMDRPVALKILAHEIAGDAHFVRRFIREARIVARLDHPNIVRGIDVGRTGGTYYLAMEYVEGESVGDLLAREVFLQEDRALRITIQVARAIKHAWEVGLIHRDIKPDNILLARGEVVKLADLGLAREVRTDVPMMTQTGTTMGTLAYMSPEQLLGERDLDVRTDIYSLGATLYHMVTGELPFEAPTAVAAAAAELHGDLMPADARNPQVSSGAGTLISKMMSRDRSARYERPSQLIEDLELVLRQQAPKYAVEGGGTK